MSTSSTTGLRQLPRNDGGDVEQTLTCSTHPLVHNERSLARPAMNEPARAGWGDMPGITLSRALKLFFMFKSNVGIY